MEDAGWGLPQMGGPQLHGDGSAAAELFRLELLQTMQRLGLDSALGGAQQQEQQYDWGMQQQRQQQQQHAGGFAEEELRSQEYRNLLLMQLQQHQLQQQQQYQQEQQQQHQQQQLLAQLQELARLRARQTAVAAGQPDPDLQRWGTDYGGYPMGIPVEGQLHMRHNPNQNVSWQQYMQRQQHKRTPAPWRAQQQPQQQRVPPSQQSPLPQQQHQQQQQQQQQQQRGQQAQPSGAAGKRQHSPPPTVQPPPVEVDDTDCIRVPWACVIALCPQIREQAGCDEEALGRHAHAWGDARRHLIDKGQPKREARRGKAWKQVRQWRQGGVLNGLERYCLLMKLLRGIRADGTVVGPEQWQGEVKFPAGPEGGSSDFDMLGSSDLQEIIAAWDPQYERYHAEELAAGPQEGLLDGAGLLGALAQMGSPGACSPGDYSALAQSSLGCNRGRAVKAAPRLRRLHWLLQWKLQPHTVQEAPLPVAEVI